MARLGFLLTGQARGFNNDSRDLQLQGADDTSPTCSPPDVPTSLHIPSSPSSTFSMPQPRGMTWSRHVPATTTSLRTPSSTLESKDSGIIATITRSNTYSERTVGCPLALIRETPTPQDDLTSPEGDGRSPPEDLAPLHDSCDTGARPRQGRKSGGLRVHRQVRSADGVTPLAAATVPSTFSLSRSAERGLELTPGRVACLAAPLAPRPNSVAGWHDKWAVTELPPLQAVAETGSVGCNIGMIGEMTFICLDFLLLVLL
uniref:Uncharacterized protein n=1 Tax=Eptatretus burgeri TaxID=7764 RepID=A0A8C4RA58_EPTBU